MKILSVDTSSRFGVVGLNEDGNPVAEIVSRSLETHSARLLPSIDMLLSLSGWNLGEIDLFGVVVGPGSFTGLRVGIATIKGLAYSKQKPVVPLKSLEVLAANAATSSHLICPMMDARKGRVYGALYQWIDSKLKTIIPPGDVDPLELIQNRKELTLCFGEGARKVETELKKFSHIEFAPIDCDVPSGSILGRSTFEAYQKGELTDAAELEPVYLRLSEAEVKENVR